MRKVKSYIAIIFAVPALSVFGVVAKWSNAVADTGSGNSPTRVVAKGGGGGGIVTVPADIGEMPASSAALLAYMRTPGFAGPADSLMPQSSRVIGVVAGGKLTSGTQSVTNLAFTVQGGQPTNGAPFWLAGADEDTQTGQGKATATRPSVGVPFPDYPQVITRNEVLLGTVIDNSNYASAGTCSVLLKLPAAPVPPQVNNRSYQGYSATPFSTANLFKADGSAAQMGVSVGETVVILFDVSDATQLAAGGYVVSNFDAAFANGWDLRAGSGLHATFDVYHSGSTTTSFELLGVGGGLAIPQLGLNCVVLTLIADGTSHGSVRGSFNGAPVSSTALLAAPAAPTSGWTFALGGVFESGVGNANPWTAGGVHAIWKMARTATDLELVTWAGAIQPTPPPATFYGRWDVHSGVSSDQYVEWYWRAIDWPPGTDPVGVAGPAALVAPPVFSTLPSTGTGPQKLTHNETWYQNMEPYTIDSEPPATDSLGYVHGSPGSRISFVARAGFTDGHDTNAAVDEIMIGVTNDDFDGHDIMQGSVIIDGVGQRGALAPCTSDGLPHYHWVRMPFATEADHTIELVVPASDVHIFAGGRAKTSTRITGVIVGKHTTFQASATTRRLLFVDGTGELAGHDSSSESMYNSTTSRLRLVYPGRVSIDGASALSFFGVYTWGGNSMLPFAREIAQQAAEGSPTTVDIWIGPLGNVDYTLTTMHASAYGQRYGELLDFLHALQPAGVTWNIFAAKSIQVGSDSVPNGNGETLSQFDAQVASLSTGRPWLHIANPRLPNTPITFGMSGPVGAFPDNTSTGAGFYAANIQSIIGF